VNRRTFIQKAALTAGSVWSFKPGNTPAQSTKTAKIVLSHRSDVRAKGGSLSGASVEKLLDTAMENFLQKKSAQAWTSLFNKSDVVGLKINCLAGRGLSTSVELTDAIVERLLQAGVSKQQIIIWDRLDSDLERAGYNIYRGTGKVQCYGNDRPGYTSEIFEYGSVGSQLSRILHEQCTTIINIPILKDHGICGISVGLKNMFGAIHNPNKYHDSVGDPYIADLNMLPQIRRKVRLTILDAMTPQYEGGPPFMPQWTWKMDSLLVAQDMVALDFISWQIIEEQRRKAGLESLKTKGREPVYIATAADSSHGLGTNDPKKIEVVHV
jgi:uncharacterized protein (DUF362 family)